MNNQNVSDLYSPHFEAQKIVNDRSFDTTADSRLVISGARKSQYSFYTAQEIKRSSASEWMEKKKYKQEFPPCHSDPSYSIIKRMNSEM